MPYSSFSICLFVTVFFLNCSGIGPGAKAISAHAPQRPNIVWISCEDIGPTFPMYGDSTIKTPNLSWLAQHGTVFSNAFSVSGVCSPSRSSLITGMYPTTIGTHNHRSLIKTHQDIDRYEVVPPPNVKTFTEYLRKAGYYTSNQHKTDYNFGSWILKAPVSSFDTLGPDADWSARASGQPFFSIFNHNVTHMFGLYKREVGPLQVSIDSVPVPPYFPDTEKARSSIARQYTNAILLDSQIGEILHQLREEGLMEQTAIFFFSDHGDGMPRNKIWLYDSGIHVPLIVKLPNDQQAGLVDDRLVSFVDFAPTVLALAGIEVPTHLQGVPFLGSNKSSKEREYIYAAKDRIDFEMDRIRAVRSKQFKYIRNYFPERPYIQNFPWSDSIAVTQEWRRLHSIDSLNEIQRLFFRKERPPEELYYIIDDPFEVNNLADQAAYQDILELFRKINDEHIEQYDDLGFVDERELRLSFWPHGVQPDTSPPTSRVDGSLVTLFSTTEGASIVYRFTKRSDRWHLYSDPFTCSEQQIVEAKAIRYGFKESSVSLVTR